MGVFLSLVFMLLGVLPPFNGMRIMFHTLLVLAVFILIPSITLYFNVRDKFWAEVMKNPKP